jgi:hypothetical protein
MTGKAQIVVATSFPPQLVRSDIGRRMEDYDRLCLRSWLECGFRILAVNDADEIPPLKARYPYVEFVAAPRNAKPVWGRGTPYIADILALLAQQSEPVLGIINSDLLFEPVLAWQQLRGLVPKKTLVTGQRYDVRSLAGGALHVYVPGFDYFFSTGPPRNCCRTRRVPSPWANRGGIIGFRSSWRLPDTRSCV